MTKDGDDHDAELDPTVHPQYLVRVLDQGVKLGGTLAGGVFGEQFGDGFATIIGSLTVGEANLKEQPTVSAAHADAAKAASVPASVFSQRPTNTRRVQARRAGSVETRLGFVVVTRERPPGGLDGGRRDQCRVVGLAEELCARNSLTVRCRLERSSDMQ